jgi:hypothetical protein
LSSGRFAVSLQAAGLARFAADGAVVFYAPALGVTSASFSAYAPKGCGGLAYLILLLVHSVFPFDGAEVTICFAADRAAASTRSRASCETLVNLCERLSFA